MACSTEDADLFVAGNLYNVTSGAPVFVRQIATTHVLLGVYFGSGTGVVAHNYSISKVVYSDEGLTEIDEDFAPGANVFQCFAYNPDAAAIAAAVLIAQPCLKSRLHQPQLRSGLYQPQLRGRLMGI